MDMCKRLFYNNKQLNQFSIFAGKIVLIQILLLSLNFDLFASNQKFQRLTTLEGLSQNDVNCIYQDSRGFIWIGTNDGLNRYDGYEFKIYQVNPEKEGGIPSNLISGITEDSKGNLWIGTANEGVFQFNVTTNTFYRPSDFCNENVVSRQGPISALYIDRDDIVWIGARSGVDLLVPTNNGKYKYWSLNSVVNNGGKVIEQAIHSFFEDDDGTMLITGGEDIYICKKDLADSSLRLISAQHPWQKSFYQIVKIQRKYLVFTYAGIFQMWPNYEKEIISIGNARSDIALRNVIIDSKGYLWGGSMIKGVHKFKMLITDEILNVEEVDYFSEDEFEKSSVNGLYEDSDGIIWIGMNGGGLNYYVPHSERFNYYSKTEHTGSLSYNKIRTFCEDSQNNLWVGTEGGGINFLASENNKSYEKDFVNWQIQPTQKAFEHIFCIKESSDKSKMLVGASFPQCFIELYRNGDNITIVRPEFADTINPAFDIHVDSKGIIWLATYGKGIYTVYPQRPGELRKVVQHKKHNGQNSISSNITRSLMEDEEGNIWIGTDDGLNFLSSDEKYKEKPDFETFRTSDGEGAISNNYILPLIQTSSGQIWIGTLGGGLNKLVEGGGVISFEAITTGNGLPSNVIKAIIEDGSGNLWLSSNRGLTRYNPMNGVIHNYDINDGLQDYEFGELAAVKRSDGQIIFGGVNGFNTFYPNKIKVDLVPPKMVITQFLILNKEIEVGEEFNDRVILKKSINNTNHLKLKHTENSIAFHFAALHYAAPDKNQYRYKLIGLDNDWIKTSSNNRVATYTYLRPGNYTFVLEGTNLDGVWSAEPAKVNITIRPPWWRSTLAYVGYVFVFIIIVISIVRYILVRNERRTELEMERFEKDKIKELSDMKLKFYTNISHEFRTPLTLLIGLLERLISSGEKFDENQRQENYSIMYRNASILLRLINQLMDFRKFEQGKMRLLATKTEMRSFLDSIYQSFKNYAERKEINFRYHYPDNYVYVWIDRDKLEKIMYNLLSNAFKFTPPQHDITLTLLESSDSIIISVSDTGVGMDEETQKNVFKRFYQSNHIRSKQVASTGIGLAFSKGLVELHQGKIDFESNPEIGTTFYVELPKGDKHLSDEDKSENQQEKDEKGLSFVLEQDIGGVEPEADKERAVPMEGGAKILVVEDNEDLRKYLKDQFSELYNVAEAIDGIEGFSKCLEIQPDIIVSDVMMPRMDGYELCKKVKTDERTSHIPVILLTAKTSPEYQLLGFKTGADAYVEKPFQFSILTARIDSILQTRRNLQKQYQKSAEITPSAIAMTSTDEKFLERIVKVIEENLSSETFTVEQLSSDYGMTQNLLNKKLRSLTGLTSKAFIRSIRMKRAAQLLEIGRYTVADVTYEVGMNDLKYFRQCFKTEFGVTPSEYMKTKKN